MMKVTTMPARIPTNGVNCRGTGDSENRNAGNIMAKMLQIKMARKYLHSELLFVYATEVQTYQLGVEPPWW